ncbi:MAG TPA: hypothetical protein VK590_09790, partial [Saprospiraceae bacterium]|nr:hypothetical protein [Saprospiraceae bacterium]
SIIKAVTTIESDNNILSTTYNNRITTLAIGGRNHYLLAANAQKSIYVFDISKTRINEKITAPYFSNQVAELEGHYSPVICMSVSKDNKLLLSGSRDNTAILWDLENMKKITTLKVQNSGQIKYVGFSNNNQDLVTISDNNIVYVWKRGQASNLYNNGQLYRFSPFNYAVWGLKENEYCFPQDTVTTLGLYNAIINYILNMHLGNKYLRDESNNNSLKTAVLEIKNIHLKLTKRKDFNNVVVDYNEALLNQRFYEFLLSVPSKQNDIEYSILKAKYQLAEWKIFLLDTIETNNAKELLYLFSNNANSKVDRQRSDADDLKLLKFYRDSVLSPLNIKYSQNTYLIKFKKWVDFQWLKYYLNTGKFIEALSVVNKLSNENPNAISYKIYLVATYLGTDKYIDAAKLYRNILNINNKGFIEQIIRELFNRLKEKNIALFNINKFEKEYGLEKLLEEQ